MDKGGLVGKIVLIVVVVLIVIAGVVFYFYNFHVFKVVRVCVGDANNIGIPCNVTQDCLDLVLENNLSDLDGAPSFIEENFQNILDEAVYCDGTCFAKEIRGVDAESGELVMLDSCEDGEKEFVMEIRGKEGLEIWDWMKSQEA